jgi:preprotein translocase subunit YajC
MPFIVIFGVFYFLVFAPMRKKQRKHTQMLQELKAGDRVVTNGGIHGTVVGVTDDVVQLRIADQIKVDVSKSAVSAMLQPDG